ncbi:class I SAM-dependent methyltransferase [Chloroflexota bacterium]
MEGSEEWFLNKKELIRKRLNKYSRKAFRMIPVIERPGILDIGCGSGVSTLELVRLTDGEVTGLDIDQDALDRFLNKIEEAGLSDRLTILNCSLLDMDFPNESFDIVWSEGSIFVIGFKKGLQEWKRLIKPGGFLVVHDEMGNVEQKLEHISASGYRLLGYFILDTDVWWDEYFAPLEKLIDEAKARYDDDREILGVLSQAQREIDSFKKYPERNRSVCFVMMKN